MTSAKEKKPFYENWLFRDFILALLVGLLTGLAMLGIQVWIDNQRENREQTRAEIQFNQSIRLENLRFVRERSSPDPGIPRPFAEFDLAQQNLGGLELAGASFIHADLSQTMLDGTNLEGADLQFANLQSASLFGTNLQGAKLSSTNLKWALVPQMDFRGMDLLGTNFEEASVWGANFHGVILSSTNFQEANVAGANFQEAILYGTNLQGAFVLDADFQNASLKNADLRGVDLGLASFQGADLRGTNFNGADLGFDTTPEVMPLEEKRSRHRLSGAIYDETTQWPEGFVVPPSELREIDGEQARVITPQQIL